MKYMSGLRGAPGYTMGVAAVMNKKSVALDRREIADVDREIAKFNQARERYGLRLERLAEKAAKDTGEGGKEIFEAYRQILGDDAFFGQAVKRVREEKVNIEYAVNCELQATIAKFDQLDDEYLKERGNDIANVCMELIAEIQGAGAAAGPDSSGAGRLIVVAEELTPTDTMLLDRTTLGGFITEKGGVTSHTVILAKALGIPAVVGVKNAVAGIAPGETVILDGDTGTVTVAPDAERTEEFHQRKKAVELQRETFLKFRSLPAATLDGVKMQVNINSGDKNSMAGFDSSACDGIGLFRTEFLYLDRDSYPTEEEQFAVYKTMAQKADGKEFIIRTLDIGGDKQVGYMDLPKESNPFLGYRAIRLCLDRVDVFKVQLRAILRASVYGDVKIMFPMIVNLEELLRAKEILEEVKAELKESGVPYNEKIPVGIMIETPAAVLLSDKLAKEAVFFSIGSNDLIQYTTATDRMNENVQGLYDSFNISVLRSIRMVCENAKKRGVKVGICGEVGSESRLVPLFVAMGVQELSVAPTQVGKVKYIISRMSAKKIQDRLDEILDCEKIAEVKSKLAELEKEIL